MLDRDELAEKTGLSERILRDITAVAEKYQVERIILFGSRARGDFQKKSDIDLAIYGCVNFPEFSYDMEENVCKRK